MTEQIKYCSVTVTTKYISKLKIEEHSEPAGFQHGMWDGRRVWHVWYRRELHTRWMGPRLAFIILRRVIPVVWSNNKNLVHYTYSRTQLYFTQQYSGNTTICFGSICGPSSGCDLTFQGSLYKNVGCFLGIGGWVWGGEGGRDLVVPIVSTMTWGYYKWIIISFLHTRVKEN